MAIGRNRLALALVVLPLLSLAACKDKPAENAVDAAPATTASVTPQTAAVEAGATDGGLAAEDGGKKHDRKRGGGGGVSAILFRSVNALPDLKDEQKTKIEAAQKTAHEGLMDPAVRDGMKNAGKDLHTELVAGIKAGKIDNAKLEPKYAAVQKAVTAMHDKELAALNALYAALEPAQRKAAVADAKAKVAQREERMQKRGERDGHADNGSGDGGGGGGGGGKSAGANPGKTRLEHLTRGLDLDADQQKKVDALAPKDEPKGGPDHAEMKKRMDALFAAFEKDGFDAKKLDIFDAKKARAPMETDTKLLASLVAILKPEQREKLAAKMEKGPGPGGPGAHGGRRGGMGGFDHSLVEVDDPEDDE